MALLMTSFIAAFGQNTDTEGGVDPPSATTPPAAEERLGGEALPFFELATVRCVPCHSGLVDASGTDVSISFSWRASMMANSARDPYWQASVRGEVLDHPELASAIEDKCATCHMPMARTSSFASGTAGRVFDNLPAIALAPNPWSPPGVEPVGAEATSVAGSAARRAKLALDGVSCSLCHQIEATGLGDVDSFSGGFAIATSPATARRPAFGPWEVDAGRSTVMRSSSGFHPTQGTHLQRSELCATCHTLYTHYVDGQGQVAGELPEQVPYLEWLHSEYPETRSCQDCHMPELVVEAPISSVLGMPRSNFSRHVFRGGNSYMLSILQAHRDELGVAARDHELGASITETEWNLENKAARVTLENVSRSGALLQADVRVDNTGGHKLPTAYPSRRAWLHFTVRGADGTVLFESGAPSAEGWIVGNDNDVDPARYEPHYRAIERSDQVQIYESIMVDTGGQVTTGLLFGSRYVKDNRLLPRGFAKETAHADIAVRGAAADDLDFLGGSDRLRYTVDVGDTRGPLAVEVDLLYQSIAYRWARNLRRHRAAEIVRFLDIYGGTGGSSVVTMAHDEATCPESR
jgi:hypothetical protein